MEGTSAKLQKRKKHAQIPEDHKHDYLTQLPEPLLHHILSFLTMKDVIRTSVLAKRWRHVWLSIPCLNFSPTKMPKYREIAFIYRSLLLHKGAKIQKMSLTFKCEYADYPHFDSWIHFAITRNVTELYLDFLKERIVIFNYYKLPWFLFSSASLTALGLKRCVIDFLINFKLSSLKILSLERVHFSGGTANDLISCCPILECLSLTNCRGSRNDYLCIVNAGLKTLKIRDKYGSYSSDFSLTVYAPFIRSFELVTNQPMKNYVIKIMRHLQSASLDCVEESHRCCEQLNSEDKGYAAVKILDEVCCRVRYLTLCGCYIQALSINEDLSLDFDSLSFGVTCLRIKTGLTKFELLGISYMLRHSRNIETLIINIDKVAENTLTDKSNDYVEDGEYWKGEEPNFVDLLCNLKTVKIYNFMKNLNLLESKHASPTDKEEFPVQLQNDMKFLRFLLNNSKVLERMIITSCKTVKFWHKSESKNLKLLLQLTQELLAFPRASRDVEISFC